MQNQTCRSAFFASHRFALVLSIGATLCVSIPSITLGAEEEPPPAARPVLTADAVQEAFVRVADHIKPSVVTIYTEKSSPQAGSTPGKPGDDEDSTPFPFGPRDPEDRRTSLGTGIVVSETGDILTNYHVVKDATIIRVIFNADTERPARPTARLIAFDEESDLAVLRLIPRNDLPLLFPAEFGDSDTVRIGEWALAVGAPFDQAQTVTVGVISAKGRHLDKDDRLSLQDYIQTDASINPGNSGGPLVNLEGKVIGINTAILSPSRFNVGIGFAVPSNTIRKYLPLLLKGKGIARGFLGIQYTALDTDVAREFGIAGGMQIGGLARRGDEFIGPAKEAGLLAGDIITHVNGREIISSDDFRRLVAGATPGTILKFTILRPGATDNETKDVTVTLGDWNAQNPEPEPADTLPLPAAPTSRLGMQVESVEKLGADDRTLFGVEAGSKGIIVTHIVPGSPADDVGLRRGLRITRLRVNGGGWQTLASPAEFTRFENALAAGARVLLQARDRNGISIYKLITLPK
jgi:serine protease Do